MAARGPKIPGARFSEKNLLFFFLKFFGPATPLWVLEPSVIMHLVSTELLIASAVFARSIKVLGCQPDAPQFREHDFPKKKNPVFLKFIEPLTPLWVLQPSQIMHLVFMEVLVARAVFTKSIKLLGRQPGAPNSREHVFPGKNVLFFENYRTSDTSMGSVSL